MAKKDIFRICTILLMSCFFWWPGPALAARVYIDIDSPGFRRLPLAVYLIPDPSWNNDASLDPDIPPNLNMVLIQDLEMCGHFQLLSPEVVLLQPKDVKLYPEKMDFRAWALIGAEALILVKVSDQEGKVYCEAQLFDVLTGKLLIWKRYKSQPQGFRQVAHRFANEVEKELTGKPGAFDTRLAYISNATGKKELYLMDYDGYGAKRLTGIRSISLSPAWCQDGNKIIFTSFWKKKPGLFLLDLSNTSRIKRVMPGFSPLCSGATWSADGKWIAFSASMDGNTEIFRLPFGENTKPQRLTRNWAIDVSPSWSPDGKKMVFVSDRAGRPDLYIMDIRRDKISRLTFEGSYNADPAWSPRGDWIAYVSRINKHFQLYRIRPDGSEATQLTSGNGDHLTPTWSPDGRLIAFSSNQQGSYDIYLIRSSGDGIKRITWDYHDETDPAWSPSPSQ